MADYDDKVIMLTGRILDLASEGAGTPDPLIAVAALTAALGKVIRGCWTPENRETVISHYMRQMQEYCEPATIN